MVHLLRHWPPERMCLSVENPFVQRVDIGGGEQQIEILKRLGKPETLHAVGGLGAAVGLGDILDGAMRNLSLGRADDRLKHLPAAILPDGIARDAIHIPDGLNGFGSASEVL